MWDIARIAGLGFCAVICGNSVAAQDGPTIQGELFTSFRHHPDDSLFVGQDNSDIATTLGGQLRLRHEIDRSTFIFELSGQSNRTTGDAYIDLPRAHYQYFGEGFDFLIGTDIAFWGVSESRDVVNVINQTYDLDNPVNPITLGQPMINLNVATGINSTLSFYSLIGFREKDHGGLENRFRIPFPVDDNAAVFEDESGRNLDFALRYQTSQNLQNASVDLAFSYFDGTNRDPLLRQANNTSDDVTLFPFYHELRQIGVETVYSRNETQLTFEGAWREALGERYFSGAVGVQYSFDDLGQNGGSVVAVAEYLYDDRSAEQPLTLFENDLHLGFRYTVNNIAGTLLTGGVYYDFESHSKIYSLALSHRLSDAVRLDVSGFFIDADDFSDPLAFVEQDGYVQVGFNYFF